ncbi:MAG: ACT domain-containing protein [Acidobacteriota bacterium]|nr:ACT domain-containing protein [Acidobacteriota bacterium]
MNESLVMTVIGKDRPGLVERLAAIVGEHGGNWEESRMVRLAGEFAGLLRVKVPAERIEAMAEALGRVEELTLIWERGVAEAEQPATRRLRVEVVGQDHPGIVHRLAATLAARGINIEELESELVHAPMSGERLFRATASLRAPESVGVESLERQLEELAADLMVDVELHEPGEG